MKTCLILPAMIFSLACAFQAHATEESLPETPPAIEDSGDLTIEFREPVTGAGSNAARITYRALTESDMLQKSIALLNQNFLFPRSIVTTFQNCSKEDAFYDADTGSITICYELIERYARAHTDSTATVNEDEKSRVVAAAFLFTHQLAHVLMKEYSLPEEKDEEARANQFMMLLMGTETQSSEIIKMLAALHITHAKETEKSLSNLAYAQLHPFSATDTLNLICMAYGIEPEKNASYVSNGILNKQRAKTCEYEYSQTMTDLWAMLGPYQKKSEETSGAAEVWQEP